MPIALVVFDLDGTLVDSERDLVESTNEMLSTYGAAPLAPPIVAGMVGDGARELVRRALAASGLDPERPEALGRFREIYDRRLLVHTRPYPGVPHVVRTLGERGVRLAVLTNKPEAPARTILDALALAPSFADVIGGDSGFPRKPDPASLHHLMRRAGCAPDETVVVGDSRIDVETGRNAGVQVCVALYGFGRHRGPLDLAGTEWLADRPEAIARLVLSR